MSLDVKSVDVKSALGRVALFWPQVAISVERIFGKPWR